MLWVEDGVPVVLFAGASAIATVPPATPKPKSNAVKIFIISSPNRKWILTSTP
jgi:hypothetical protein